MSGDGGRPEAAAAPDMLAAALGYADLGLPIVPMFGVSIGLCECREGAACRNPGKHPRITDWQSEATVDPATIRRWRRRWPNANIGLPTGAASWLVVLDVDGQAGTDSLVAFENRHGELPATVEAISGSGEGRHLYLLAPADPATVGNKVRLMPGLDIRGEGGLVVAPPSRHATGRRYTWVPGRAPGEVDLAPLPKPLLATVNRPEPPRPRWNGTRHRGGEDGYALRALEAELALTAAAPPGRRNDQLNRSAHALFRLCPEGRLPADVVARGLHAAARHAGLGEHETLATIESAARARGITP